MNTATETTQDLQTKKALRDLDAELYRLDTVLRTSLRTFKDPARAAEGVAHARIRAAFYLGRTAFSGCLNVIVFGGLEELGKLRAAVKNELEG